MPWAAFQISISKSPSLSENINRFVDEKVKTCKDFNWESSSDDGSEIISLVLVTPMSVVKKVNSSGMEADSRESRDAWSRQGSRDRT
jgi:hypothetical protein